MLKIVYVHNSLDLGGAQAIRYMFLKYLPRNMFDVRVCCLGAKGEFAKKIEELGYKVDALNKSYKLFCLTATLSLGRYLKNIDPDIVHSSLFYANYHSALACFFFRKRLITEEHGEHRFHMKRKHLIYRLMGRIAAGMSDFILCCGGVMKREIGKMYGVKGKKIIALKNMVEDKKQEVKHSREETRKKLNIPHNAFVMGTVSTLSVIKNQKVLIESLVRIRSNNKSAFLVLTGDGPLKHKLRQYAVCLNVDRHICFTGARRDIADILNSFDAFVLPSLSEGIPISLLEAMSAGLPCIATRVGGIEEIITDRVNGFLVSESNPNQIVDSIRIVMNQPELAGKIGKAARKYVLDNFQPVNYVNAVVKLYLNYKSND